MRQSESRQLEEKICASVVEVLREPSVLVFEQGGQL